MTDKNLKRVVALLASETQLTMFTEQGEALVVPIDGPHDTARLSADLTPQLTGDNVVEIDFNDYLIINTAIPPEYEETGQLITRVIDGVEVQGIFFPKKIEVVAKVEDEEVVIPAVEALTGHAKRSARENSPAVAEFMLRVGKVAKDRRHSAEDLMSFISKSEMPLTNDGRIIAYKRVNKRGNDFVDCHSGTIIQNVGCRVWMDIDGVDPDRNRSCSHGLHVANLGYLGGFTGSHTLMVLVNPEDFIAVPHGEDTKARVMSYDVVGVLSGTSHEVVCSGSSDDAADFESLIKDLVEGRIVSMTTSIKVGKRCMLEKLPITDTVLEEPASKPVAESSGKSLAKDPKEDGKGVVNMARTMKRSASSNAAWNDAPKEVIAAFDMMRVGNLTKSAIAAKVGTSTRSLGRWADKYDYDGYVASKAANMTIKERTVHMYEQWLAGEVKLADLLSFKKARKKGWLSLGLTAKQEAKIVKAVNAT